jgi:hypothetical protein
MIAVFNAMKFSLGVIPYAVKALADVYVSTKRCKVRFKRPAHFF